MADEQKGIATQAQSFWQGLPARRKAILAAGIVLPLVLVGYLALSGAEEDWAVLYSGLAPEDAGEIIADLDGRGVPHRLQAGGTVVEVPADRVHEVRIATASSGLPRGGGVGFEIFDDQSFGTSSFVEQVNYRRALQGELSRSIAALAAVDDARVHVAMGERSVFREADEPPSASVALGLRRGRSLSGDQVRGIVNLVASSVDGLDSTNVVVIDDRGNVLSQGDDEELDAEQSRELEATLAKRVREMLERVVGPGHAAVTVTAQMNYRQVEKTEELYDQSEPAVRSETRTVEGDLTPGETGGVAGARGNLPGAPAPEQAANGASKRLKETRNYEINKIVRHTVEPNARIDRLHVAVLVDHARDEDGEPVARDAEQMKQLAAIAREAAGIDETRGDRLEISAVPFAEETDPTAVPAPEAAEKASSPLPVPVSVAVAAGVGLLVLIVAAVVLLRGRKRRRGRAEVVQLPAPVGDLEAALEDDPEADRPGSLEGAERLGLAAPNINTRVLQAVRNDTQQAARVLSGWLADDGKNRNEAA